MTPSNTTTSPLIKPTIGRKVWFFPNGLNSTSAGPVEVFDEKQALDATIVCVWGDRMVNLSVTDHGGRVHSVCSCALRHPGDAPQTGYYCEWMPYQLGQAKTEEVKTVKAEQDVVIVGAGHSGIGLTPADIHAAIVDETYHVFPSTTVTVCMLVLRNGAKVVGLNYGAIDPSRHSAEIGRFEARKMAVEKVWELEGYLLRERLAAAKR